MSAKSTEPVFLEAMGERLRTLREEAGLTQQDVASRLGVGQTVVSRIERRTDLLLSTVRSYVVALGGSLDLRALMPSGTIIDLNGNSLRTEIDQCDQLTFLACAPARSTSEFTRDVVFSIHPGHANRILSGEKTVELRRRFTEDLAPGGLALIYSTSPTRALTGVAQIHDVQKLRLSDLWKQHRSRFCVRKGDFDSYFSGLQLGYAIVLRAAQPLRRPISLQELRDRCGFAPPQSFQYASASLRGLVDHERTQDLN